jgi:hypothetical protein
MSSEGNSNMDHDMGNPEEMHDMENMRETDHDMGNMEGSHDSENMEEMQDSEAIGEMDHG